MGERSLDARFESFPWRDDAEGLDAWRRGLTGHPLVDAGMRELLHSGGMHNRVRMVAASFLVKDLMVHWSEGARHFADKLVDADPANNAMGWQWVSGSGADAAPYFRVFNPMTQSQRFDPEGAYIRRWVPELARLSERHIHAPWLADAETLKEAGIALGEDYPHPLVDHALARRRALYAYGKMRGEAKS